ncbi:Aminopeptidase N [Oleispira antarctica RB-8]|uniref:Aminopeptidase N n=1 Tax=Oleispira antarctica RB-8 TaxID=698738 RepID=R4YM22_OLEAN|nr:Aminopeptidase N [Oleispira antarctica RB-8]
MRDAQPESIYLKDYQAPHFVIEETHLRFDLFEDYAQVDSRLVMRRNREQHENVEAPLVLVGKQLELLAIAIDGVRLSDDEYLLEDELLTIHKVSDSFELEISNRIEPQNNTALEGLYKSGGMFCTQCEAEGFRRITYYLDRPDVMSIFTTEVIADKAKYPILLSNGNAIAQGDLENGRHSVSWHDPHRKPCYLFALVAGDLMVKEGSFMTMNGRKVELKIFVEPQNIDKTEYAMDALKRSMKWDEDKYGREYDLDIFMIVAVDDFNMGAMENKGLNIFNSSCVLANPQTATDASYLRIEAIVAHEYFHNWSGNRVTCRDWFQLSLKEGFTVYRDSQFTADMNSAAVKRIEDASIMRTVQFAEDAGPMAHPVQPDSFMEIANFYTVTIYEKGSEIVGMIHKLLGAKGFRKGSDLYFERHDGQAVTINEFVSAMEDANGTSLTQFKRWYKSAGTPVVNVESYYDSAAKTYTLTFNQSCDEPFLIPIELGLIGRNGQDINAELAAGLINKRDAYKKGIFQLTEKEQVLVFTDVKEEPVPSLLRDFSAPIKLNYDYSRDQLMFLMQHDSDGFNRWDAGQNLALDVIYEVMQQFSDGTQPKVDGRLITAYFSVLKRDDIDHAMLAKMLLLPSVSYIGETQDVIDILAINQARSYVQSVLAEALAEKLAELYKKLNVQQSYLPEPEQMAQRGLKNAALSYLLKTDHKKYCDLAVTQFENSDNMTDSMAALASMVNSGYKAQAESALESFYDKWQAEPLVVNQWLAVQAGSAEYGTIENINKLLEHEAFDIKNPNKVRSVIGAFAGQSLINFHALDGSGYQLLADKIILLNQLNPQIASRLVSPLSKWRRYVDSQAQQMKQQLQRIMAQNNLSKDVYEVVSKSLIEK